MKIENLVVTMNQKNIKKYDELNLKSDAVIANQGKENKYIEFTKNKNTVKFITTNTKGVGINRNISLIYSSGDICLFSDDDMKYYSNYAEIVEEAFNKLKDADIIIFNIDTIGKNVNRRINQKIKRVNKFNFLNYGTVRIAFKRKSIFNKNIWFSTMFGGGTTYSSGEDTLFLAEAIRKKLKIYTYPASIASVDQSNSTWFDGYNEKFFFDKGALISQVFPFFQYIFILFYFPLRFKSSLSTVMKQKLMLIGSRMYKHGISYDEWKKL